MLSEVDCVADPALGDRINSYAVVSYIPGAVGEFITRLREDLVKGCTAQSHVTILPPRALFSPQQELESTLGTLAADYGPFLINMPSLRVFRQTSVVFAEIGAGHGQLVQMHSAFAAGPFAAEEPFEYHPHITLAQGIHPDDLDGVLELACRRWKESAPSDSALIENVTFVQNTLQNRWIDLMEWELRGAVSAGPLT